MKFKTRQESISEILGPEANAGTSRASADLFSTTLTGSARVHQTFRLTSDDAHVLPQVIIPAEFDLDDFFATVATYYHRQSPITAYVHVLGKDIAECFDPARANISPDSGSSNRTRLALLGACLGETAITAHKSGEEVLGPPPYSACKRSLGYTLARTVALYPNLDVNLATQRWERLRRLTGMAVSYAAVQAVRTVHAAACGGAARLEDGAEGGALQSALASYMATPDAGDALQYAILGCYPRLNDLASEFDGPFDMRMNVFLKVVEGIQDATRGSELDSLALGYFCNRIQPGSFAHSRVLARLVEFFPSALVWYGVFSATSPGFEFRYFANGLFAKLGRDISLPFSFAQSPQCDLSLDELDVLMRAAVKAEAIKPIQQKIASVSLLPGLDVLSRFTPDDDSHGGREFAPIRSGIADERLTQATRLLDEAVSLLSQLGGRQETWVSQTSNVRRQRKR